MKISSLLWSTCNSIWNWIGCNRLIVVVAVVAALSGTVWWCGWDWLRIGWSCVWDWLRKAPIGWESGSTTVRNLGLVVGGFVAIWIAIWRGVVADRQAKAAQYQAETSWRGLLNERYQKGTDMLRREDLSVRLVGIYELQNLAEDEPEQYHVKIMRLLCAFVRHPTESKDRDDNSKLTGNEREPNIKDYQVSEDVQAAMTAIGNRSNADIELELKGKFRLNLNGTRLAEVALKDADLAHADLCEAIVVGANLLFADLTDVDLTRAMLIGTIMIGTDLTEADLSHADLTRADLTRADLTEADLSHADLTEARLGGARLGGARLIDADLTRAHLGEANLTGVDLSEAKGLTQEQLDQAEADPDKPPKLDGLCDADTGVPLKWHGKEPCMSRLRKLVGQLSSLND